MSTAIYNEIDPFAAAWLRNLIERGHIAPGAVDERSIADLTPDAAAGSGQRHFFAGIGGWSYALRLAGWPDDVDVWTGSCPCQPFSAAGRRGGFDDKRHLWPAWFALIQQCRPAIVFGEQVASPDGLTWLDAVRTDLEGAGYAFGASDLCAAGVGAPHIRQRLYFAAYTDDTRSQGWLVGGHRTGEWAARSRGVASRMEHVEGVGQERPARAGREARDRAQLGGATLLVGDSSSSRSGRDTGGVPRAQREGERERQLFGRVLDVTIPAGPTRGFWHPAEWVACRDGKARPIEPGTFPLAHGVPNRVGRLRGYGNAIVPQVAATFVQAVIEALWL